MRNVRSEIFSAISEKVSVLACPIWPSFWSWDEFEEVFCVLHVLFFLRKMDDFLWRIEQGKWDFFSCGLLLGLRFWWSVLKLLFMNFWKFLWNLRLCSVLNRFLDLTSRGALSSKYKSWFFQKSWIYFVNSRKATINIINSFPEIFVPKKRYHKPTKLRNPQIYIHF